MKDFNLFTRIYDRVEDRSGYCCDEVDDYLLRLEVEKVKDHEIRLIGTILVGVVGFIIGYSTGGF